MKPSKNSPSSGKLVVSRVKNRELGFLIQDNRLKQVLVPGEQTSRIGAVYVGRIRQIKENLQACFVEIADKEIVFLPFAQCKNPVLTNRVSKDDSLQEGDILPVQIIQDPLKTKQAMATTKLTLSGRLAVIAVGSSHVGISAKLGEKDREHIKAALTEEKLTDEKGNWIVSSDYDMPPYGFIIRTEAAKVPVEELFAELHALEVQITQLYHKARYSACHSLLLSAGNAWEKTLEELPTWEYEEVVTDLPEFAQETAPYFALRNMPVRRYSDASYSLAKLYGLETKLEEALGRRVWLKSGAYLVIDVVEALTVIDVNSGKYEARKPSEDAIWEINREAAREIALQLKLRNLSGMILIDFINMKDTAKEKELLEYMRSLTAQDRIPVKVVDITPLGLMELTRKKKSRPLAECFVKYSVQ